MKMETGKPKPEKPSVIRPVIREITETGVTIEWEPVREAKSYRIYWADKDTPAMRYRLMDEGEETVFTLRKSTHVPHYLKVGAVTDRGETVSEAVKTPIRKVFHRQLERLNRGLIAVHTEEGVFLSWRLMTGEVSGYSDTGLTGTDFAVYKNGVRLAEVTDSTNFLDRSGTMEDRYQVAPVEKGREGEPCAPVGAWVSGENFIDIPLKRPEGGITPAGQEYCYHANDMSVGDVDGDGEYEFILKWDPENSHDVSHRGYTGNCYIDCYKLSGTLLWRLDLGVNIRAGAHYTQFMVFDFDGDGKAEMSVKTAPGTRMIIYGKDEENGGDGGAVRAVGCGLEAFITLPAEDRGAGVTHQDNYVCSASDYRNHLIEVFRNWDRHPEVVCGRWPKTLEECFGIPVRHEYPLNAADAADLADYFLDGYAPGRSDKNELRKFEGFIYEGPEYLTMFAGDGTELETIPFPYPRVDDGLLWGDYSMSRIEPCNRVDRFLSGVAYLDGEHPSLIVCRGYYTRSCIAAYDFKNGRHELRFSVDSGFVPMDNPFRDNAHAKQGSDPVYGILAGQGNHSLSTADVDGDGYMEIIYGAAVIDHDGSVLYSSYGYLPDGKTYAKFGHGDAMHVADIDPDRPGLEIFHVFEGAKAAPYGYALCDAETGEVIFGEYAENDLGRCMVGDVNPNVRGLCCWVNDMYDCRGNRLSDQLLGTNYAIRWAPDLSTQILDGVDYVGGKHRGIVGDNTHGIMLAPQGMATNNGTKGNPCLAADLFGDWREELILRKEDDSAIRIYTNAELTDHKLFTLMHDTMYRTAVAWQNNCYNQPGYPSFYFASDMDWEYVAPERWENEREEDVL